MTAPVKSAADDVLELMDPDPDGGYSKSEKFDGVTSEIWIPCIMNPQHLVELCKYTFKYSALQSRNQLGRTALHEACFANRSDSHFQVIRVLVDDHVQNLHAVDDCGCDARSLVVAPRGRPDSPSGHRLREDIIDDHRDDLLDDYTAACEAIDGGGGAFVEALMVVVPDEALEIVVGAGGSAGVYGGTVQLVHEDDPAATEVEEVCGVARGGHPGGGNGHGGNECWAAGGGGGYSMVQRFTKTGPVPVFVAGGGGGGGARDGCPGGGLDGELPGMRVDKRNGRMGTQERGGAAGDSGEAALCTFPSKPGAQWQGGNGAQFGGGGGGGLFGGGGGGTSPGIAGGGGGGSSYVDVTACKDFVVLQGVGNFPGGTKHQPPKACGIGEWDYTGGFSGSGGGADIRKVHPGKNGAVKILRPGFYFEDSSLLQALG